MDLTSFLIYCIIATFTPGPTNLILLSTVNHSGAKQAMNYAYGATIGFGLLLATSAALNTMLVAIIPKIVIGMQIIGSLYMSYLIYQIYIPKPSKPITDRTATFIAGFLMQFLNPKVVLFALTVVPTYIMPYSSAIFAVSIGIVAVTVIGFLAFTTWVLFGTIFKTFLQEHTQTVNVIMALLLASAAIMIWI
ncbi:threonine/homoserine/homoserine lactone efflux protein [Paenibacillus phyllosphaerae]|uniref:Threonine/homoserine/homoserine lactone efflux protein n=1 Tax=Paenibacillus phyllosphaerae TaxID=274593 RepID=A0A7W5FQ30_9BACL|nr:LysE family transporter [Paenibacillus phyllosphaerae]MBB3112858.1 threonine/homoserine/homoserine lactone efflux protein [Paenibacillus phyllosphaerae]